MGTIGRYGPRVVGKQQHERERTAIKQQTTLYGSRVTGAGKKEPAKAKRGKAAKNALAAKNQGGQVNVEVIDLRKRNEELEARLAALEAAAEAAADGELPETDPEPGDQSAAPKTTDPEPGEDNHPDLGTADAAAAAAGADGYLNLNELAIAVQENPALIDGFLARELERTPKPRLGALRALLSVELDREDQPARQGVVEQIQTTLDELGG